MKKRAIILFAIATGCLGTISASAQEKMKVELSYNISSPLGSFKNDYIGKTSYKGVTGELSYAFSPKFSLGFYTGYQNYYQKYDRQLYKLDGNQLVSAVMTNQMDVTPLLIRGTYYPMGTVENPKVQPYVSGAAGANMVTYGQYLGEFGGTQTSASLALQAGAGVKIPFGKSYNQNGVKLGATYNYMNYNKNNLTKLNSVGYNVGVVFGLR